MHGGNRRVHARSSEVSVEFFSCRFYTSGAGNICPVLIMSFGRNFLVHSGMQPHATG